MFQMAIIFTGLFVAASMLVYLLPGDMTFMDALHVAGKMQKLKAIDTDFDLNNRYNIWSGIIGGLFLNLAYFGTDQSQVGRYLTGKSTTESRLGLVMNGLLKIPMQFLILLIGILVFVFYQFHVPPLFFNQVEVNRIENSQYASEYQKLNVEFVQAQTEKQRIAGELVQAIQEDKKEMMNATQSKILAAEKHISEIRGGALQLMNKNNPKADTNDSNYVFLTFVTTYLPKGLIGLLIAIILLASMGSTAGGLNALASTSVIDFYKRFINTHDSEKGYLAVSRWSTVFWGVFCVVVALYASKLGNLIEAVNELGSLFYGTILGVFMVAFFLKNVGGTAVFYAALIAEAYIALAWFSKHMAYLWLNVVGCLLVIILACIIQKIISTRN